MWTYVQLSGAILTPAGKLMSMGYSGAPGYVNQPGAQIYKNKGPCPCGMFTIGPPHDTEHHGPYFLALFPDPANVMFGRSAFGIHGDSLTMPGTASQGCIILPRFARERIWESDDRELHVVADSPDDKQFQS